MQIGCFSALLLALMALVPAVADDNIAPLWKQALNHHGWSLNNGSTTGYPQCSQMQGGLTAINLHKTGFHGTITYVFTLTQAMRAGTSNFTILQMLPAGVYADPYELGNLITPVQKPHDKHLWLSSFKVFGDIDVERIESDCTPTVLSVSAYYSELQEESHNAQLHMELTVPLHARYPPPQLSQPASLANLVVAGLYQYNITQPLIKLHHIDRLGLSTSCYLTSAYNGMQGVQQALSWRVPTGAMWHQPLVEAGTILSAVCSICVLLRAMFQDRQMAH